MVVRTELSDDSPNERHESHSDVFAALPARQARTANTFAPPPLDDIESLTPFCNTSALVDTDIVFD